MKYIFFVTLTYKLVAFETQILLAQGKISYKT